MTGDEVPEYLRLLQRARRSSSITNGQIAERADITPTTVINVMAGHLMGRPDTVRKIVAALMPLDSPDAAAIIAAHQAARDAAYDARYGKGADTQRNNARRNEIAEAINNLADAVRELARRD